MITIPTKWGRPGENIENPVGKTGIVAGIAGVIAAVADMIGNDPSPENIATAVVFVLVALFGEKVRRQ